MPKQCKTCLSEKPESEFYKDTSMRDGLFSSCKSCIIQKSLRYKATHRPYVRRLEKERQKSIMASPEKRARYNHRQREAFQRNSFKWRARQQLKYAIRIGRITRGPCEVCGSTEKIQGHHTDYSKPFDVQWLCPLHHAIVHGRKD